MRNRPDVRVINYTLPPGVLMSGIVSELEERGLDPVVVVSSDAYRDDSDSSRRGRRDGVQVLQVPAMPPAIRWLVFLLRAAWVTLARPVPNTVLLTQPPLGFVLLALCARLRGGRVVLHVMDVYPATLTTSVAKRSPLVARLVTLIFEPLAKAGLRLTNCIISLGDCMRDVLVASGAPPARVTVVENWPSLTPAEELQEAARPAEVFRMLYSGNLGTGHDWETMARCLTLEAVEEHWPGRVRIRIGADGRRLDAARAAMAGHPCVEFLEPCSREQLQHRLESADVHLVTLRPEFVGLMVPSKFYNACALGKPVIFVGPGTSQIARTIVREGCGRVVQPGDHEGFKAVVDEYMASPELLSQHARHALSFAARHFADGPPRVADLYSGAREAG
jgi:colanic acid biosynthesis glycosyl transferase WcaI